MKPKIIQSRSNPQFKALREKMKPGFDGDVIPVEGIKLIREAFKAGLKPVSFWSDGDLPLDVTCPSYRIPAKLYRAVSPTKSGNAPLGLFRRPELATAKNADLSRGRYLLLGRVQEPGNAGALVRAAAAFGFDGVLWRRPCVFPFHHACIRASAGCVFHLPHYLFEPDVDTGGDLHLIGASTHGTNEIESFHWPEHLVLVMGNEGQGLDEDLCKLLKAEVHIPISSRVESLNVAGAAHILMYAASRGGNRAALRQSEAEPPTRNR